VRNEAERRRIASALKPRDDTAVWPYIAAHIELVEQEFDACARYLKEACQRGLSGFARVRANVLLAALGHADRTSQTISIDDFDPAFAYPEVAGIIETGDVSLMLNQTKRVFGYP
jgi:hypothetical protein